MQVVKNVFRMLTGAKKADDNEGDCANGCCGPFDPDYRVFLQVGHKWYMRSFPRGFGKRAKRSCMRKALRYYKEAYKAIKLFDFVDKADKVDAKFKTLFFVGTAYRALCEDDNVTHTIDRLTNLMLYEMTDDMIDEYDLAVMGLQASSLVSMYRTGYPASKLAEAREMMQSMEDTDPEAFEIMPKNFIQSHFHYKGLMNLIEGRLEDARKDFEGSLEIKSMRHDDDNDNEDDFDKAFEKWTRKLLSKTEKKILRIAAQTAPNVTEEDIEDLKDQQNVKADEDQSVEMVADSILRNDMSARCEIKAATQDDHENDEPVIVDSVEKCKDV